MMISWRKNLKTGKKEKTVIITRIVIKEEEVRKIKHCRMLSLEIRRVIDQKQGSQSRNYISK